MEKIDKKILFILATHGNESFSINVLKNIERKFPKEKYGFDWIIGNENALEKGMRFTQADLNRSAPGNPKSNVYEERRVFEIIKLANNYDYVIDIHGTVSDTGIFTIIPKPNLQNILLTALLPIERNVFWYSKQSLNKGPIVQFCRPPALEIECGPKDNPKIALELEIIITKILNRIAKKDYDILFKSLLKKEFYSVYGSQIKFNKGMKDFKYTKLADERFYPLLVNQYRETAFYKMKKVNFQKLFIY